MKIKALSRSVEGNTRSNSGDIKKLSRNLDPKHKPLERAREYTRAVTSAKLERMFAKVRRREKKRRRSGYIHGVVVVVVVSV